MKDTMNQFTLELYWLRNRIALALGLTLNGIACTGDSFEQTIKVDGRTWRRDTGTRLWKPAKPLRGNLLT